MSTEAVMAGIVSTEQQDEEKASTNDQGSTAGDDTNCNHESTTIQVMEPDDEDEDDFQTKYNLNIFNAYILLKGKAQIGDSVVLKDLRFSVYVVLVIECAAMLFLTRLVMLQSGDTINDYKMSTWPLANSWILFPFFIIAAVTFYKEVIRVLTDMEMLKNDIDDESSSREFWIIKCLEVALAVYGAFGYLVMLAFYANHEYSGMLFTVLKMLAYKFILQLDEGMVSLVIPELNRILRKEEKPELEQLFIGTVQAKFRVRAAGSPGGRKSGQSQSRPHMQGIITIFLTYALVLQALYSCSWLLFCFIPLVWSGSLSLCFCCNHIASKVKSQTKNSEKTKEDD